MARLFDRHQFASVLDCAGNCALKACELNPDLARRINVEGVANLLSQTVPRGIRLVHLSVDLVFSGRRDGGYVEDDPVDPVTVYGKTMAEGEQLILAADPTACILRISLPMGVELQRPCRGNRLDHVANEEVSARRPSISMNSARPRTPTA